MNILKKISSAVLREYIFSQEVINVWRKKKRTIYILGAPYHNNLGDHAQSYCLENWSKCQFPGYNIKIIDSLICSLHQYSLLHVIRKKINSQDKIFLHSGYHTTDLYMLEENLQRMVIRLFPEKRIIIFPQTIYYQLEKEQRISSEIYNSHSRLTLMCRDDISYEKAQMIFQKCRLLKYPDIVTSMIGQYKYNTERKGILLCFRNDKESAYSKEQIEKLQKTLQRIDQVELVDTNIDLSVYKIARRRKEILESIWSKYASYRLIITDRYHGTIFALIANTPVLVLGSTDHKLRSGVKWFPKEFEEYVRFVEDFSAIKKEVQRVYDTDFTYILPAYFKENYYDKLKGIIEEEDYEIM